LCEKKVTKKNTPRLKFNAAVDDLYSAPVTSEASTVAILYPSERTIINNIIKPALWNNGGIRIKALRNECHAALSNGCCIALFNS